jgi:hypothetical protein
MGVPASTGKTSSGVSVGVGTGVGVEVGGTRVAVGGWGATVAAGKTAELQDTTKHKHILDAIEQI